MRVLFWGTPEFACPPLEALLGEGFEVSGVVTQPDKPVGRSRSRLVAPPVKEIALRERLPVFQPGTTKDPEFREMIGLLAPDISVVVAYGRLLGEPVIALPKHGTINIHASLLPRLRGAAPIQAAIREGHTETGVTIMRMVRELDAGPIILQQSTPIAEDETFGELSLRLSELGAATLIQALAMIDQGVATETAQDDDLATYAPKIDRDIARIRWTDDAAVVARHIRAHDPAPGAWTTLEGRKVKLFGGREVEGGDKPGTVMAIEPAGMIVACGTGAVRVQQVHPEGGKRLDAAAWHRGRGVSRGNRFD